MAQHLDIYKSNSLANVAHGFSTRFCSRQLSTRLGQGPVELPEVFIHLPYWPSPCVTSILHYRQLW